MGRARKGLGTLLSSSSCSFSNTAYSLTSGDGVIGEIKLTDFPDPVSPFKCARGQQGPSDVLIKSMIIIS